MAEIRQGYLDDYTQNTSGNIGIGSSSPVDAKLEIVGGTTTQELNIVGVGTFTSASGFVEKHTNYTENVSINSGNSGSLSGEIVVGTGLTMIVGTSVTSGQGGMDSLKVSNMFKPPSGTTNQRPIAKPGALFYNFDIKTVEFFDGNQWKQVITKSTRGRGVIGGGYVAPLRVSDIEFVEIMSFGIAQSFGDLTVETAQPGPAADSTRGLFCGGMLQSGNTNVIQYITIQSTGNGIDFGDLTRGTNAPGALASSTRCVTGGGSTPSASNVIDYFEIQTLGNALDFGDLTSTTAGGNGMSSPVRGIFSGGYSGDRKRINFITISSKGDAITFGELSQGRGGAATGGNSVRGITACGDGGGHKNTIDYVNIAHLGNAIDFGDTTQTHTEIMGSSSNHVRMLVAGGNNPGQSPMTDIDFITISSSGGGFEFGDLSTGRRGPASLSDSHGGLGGF